MSEQNFNGGGVATQEPPAETPDAPDTGSRRNLVIVGIAVAVALARRRVVPVPLWRRQLDADRSGAAGLAQGTEPGRARRPSRRRPARPRSSITPAASKDTDGRDPFKALLKPEASASASPVATTAPSRVGVDPGEHPGSARPRPRPAATVVATVNLVSIDSKAKTANFNVATTGAPTKYSGIKVGETFATFFKLFDLGTKCAQVQYGDVTDSVCMGTPLVVHAAS